MPCFQRLILEGRNLVDGSLLRGYGNLKNATIFLVYRLRGGAPTSTQPSSCKHAVKKGISSPSGSKAKTFEAKEFFLALPSLWSSLQNLQQQKSKIPTSMALPLSTKKNPSFVASMDYGPQPLR
jgi:hypothetical protein